MVKSFSFVEVESITDKTMKDVMLCTFKDIIAKTIRKECSGKSYEFFSDTFKSGLGKKVKDYIKSDLGKKVSEGKSFICHYNGRTDECFCECTISIGGIVEYISIRYVER